MGSSFEKIVRYQSALKRDLYNAIEIWRELQAEQREREEAEAGNASPDPKGARGIISGRALRQEDEGAQISLI